MFEVVTDRLRLRPFQAADLPGFVAYRSHPAVARYQSWDETYSMTDAERFLDSQQGVALGEPGAWVQLAVVDRDGGGLRIFAQADDRNVAVHRLLERLGFRCEASLVEADWFKDEWSTLRIYGLLAREWGGRAQAPTTVRPS